MEQMLCARLRERVARAPLRRLLAEIAGAPQREWLALCHAAVALDVVDDGHILLGARDGIEQVLRPKPTSEVLVIGDVAPETALNLDE